MEAKTVSAVHSSISAQADVKIAVVVAPFKEGLCLIRFASSSHNLKILKVHLCTRCTAVRVAPFCCFPAVQVQVVQLSAELSDERTARCFQQLHPSARLV